MVEGSFEATLVRKIEEKYQSRGDSLGWRLLYSPRCVLDGASVAFIGLNPGGDRICEDHAKFAMDTGSAYESESWGAEPGNNRLQRQVRFLFNRLSVRPDEVLAGNLVPFRSPSWKELKHAGDALSFGREVWQEIFCHVRPKIVVAMGGDVIREIEHILCVDDLEHISLNWGAITAKRGRHRDGHFIGLPHLSRFPVMNRQESEGAIRQLLNDLTHYP